MIKELTMWSDWKLNPCRLKSRMTAEGIIYSITSTKKINKDESLYLFSDIQITKGRNSYEYVDGKDTSVANWMR